MTPEEGVQALLKSRERVAKAELELDAAKAEKKQLEELVLPPIFLQARIKGLDLPNGARAVKDNYAWARLDRPGTPKRTAMLTWLEKVGEQDAIKATLVAKWGKGEYEVAQRFHKMIMQDGRADASLDEDVHWKTLERVVLERVRAGDVVPLDEINATYGERVTITRNPIDPTEGAING